MKRVMLTILMLVMAVSAKAQCVAEVKDVVQDEARGSIVVKTEYKLNGVVVQQGETRYDENSGTNEEIIARVKEDIAIHCENIIRRIPGNETYRQTEALKINKEKTQPIIDAIKTSLVGVKDTKVEAVDTYKDKEIKVTYDAKNTISDISAVEPN